MHRRNFVSAKDRQRPFLIEWDITVPANSFCEFSFEFDKAFLKCVSFTYLLAVVFCMDLYTKVLSVVHQVAERQLPSRFTRRLPLLFYCNCFVFRYFIILWGSTWKSHLLIIKLTHFMIVLMVVFVENIVSWEKWRRGRWGLSHKILSYIVNLLNTSLELDEIWVFL